MFFLAIHIPFLKKLEIRYVSFPWTDVPATSHNVPRKFQKVGETAMMGHHGRGCGKRCGRQGWEGEIRPFLDFGLPGSHNISLFCCAPCSASVPAVSVLNLCGASRSHSQGEGSRRGRTTLRSVGRCPQSTTCPGSPQYESGSGDQRKVDRGLLWGSRRALTSALAGSLSSLLAPAFQIGCRESPAPPGPRASAPPEVRSALWVEKGQ